MMRRVVVMMVMMMVIMVVMMMRMIMVMPMGFTFYLDLAMSTAASRTHIQVTSISFTRISSPPVT
jgi:hypothetical protein